MRESPAGGLMAEFETPDALLGAVRAARQAGYSRLEAYSPHPVREVSEALGYRLSILPWVPLVAALVGGAVQYYAQYWMNVVDYPLNVGGRPLHSWPAFVPATIIVGILWAGVASFLVMLFALGLPRLHHPVFGVPGFERASQDRFFLAVERNDPRFDPDATRRFLESLAPLAVRDVPE